jgi:hypothetical protein
MANWRKPMRAKPFFYICAATVLLMLGYLIVSHEASADFNPAESLLIGFALPVGIRSDGTLWEAADQGENLPREWVPLLDNSGQPIPPIPIPVDQIAYVSNGRCSPGLLVISEAGVVWEVCNDGGWRQSEPLPPPGPVSLESSRITDVKKKFREDD